MAGVTAATLAHITGVVLRRPDDGARWVRIAEGLTARLGDPVALVGRTAQQRGNVARAALKILQPREGSGADRGRAHYALGLSLPPTEVAAAREHMQAAKEALTGPGEAATVGAVDAWLSAHAAP